MDETRDRLEQDAFARHLSMELLDLEPGRARASMRVTPDHRNAFGMVHGGAIFSLADYVFQSASNSHGVLAVAIQATISFLKAPRSDVLLAEAEEVSCTRRLATYSIRVTEEDGTLLAQFQGTVYRMPEKPHGSA
jgi:acyl-CoA thioesterase